MDDIVVAQTWIPSSEIVDECVDFRLLLPSIGVLDGHVTLGMVDLPYMT